MASISRFWRKARAAAKALFGAIELAVGPRTELPSAALTGRKRASWLASRTTRHAAISREASARTKPLAASLAWPIKQRSGSPGSRWAARNTAIPRLAIAWLVHVPARFARALKVEFLHPCTVLY